MKQFIPTLLLILFLIGVGYSQATLTFQFNNAVILGSPPNSQLQFDVELKASITGTYHSNGQVYFSYNTNAFGSSIKANNNVSVSKLALLQGEVSGLGDKYSLTTNDNNSNTFSVTWNSGFPGAAPSSTALNEVTTAFLPLMRITIDISDPDELAGISFNESLMNGQQFYRAAANDDDPYSSPNLYSNNLQSQALPLELLSFTATPTENNIQLQWASTGEINFAGYELQRSTDGITFEKIAWVESKSIPLSTQSYTYTDQTARADILYYYRLKMMDTDGSYVYSLIRSARLEEAPGKAVLYPNPTSGNCKLFFDAPADGSGILHIFDSMGRVLMEREATFVKGVNLLEITLNDVVKGVYFIQLLEGRKIFCRERLVKIY